MSDILHNGNISVGLLGGSFNPAHNGHVHISIEALKRLGLDEVWWLVSPKNPLKSCRDMKSLDSRLKSAKKSSSDFPEIKVTDIEVDFNTSYTSETIKHLKRKFPKIHFVWLMGADNLAQIDEWHKWKDIFNSIPIAVFDRKPYTHNSLRSKASVFYGHYRIDNPKDIFSATAPAWVFVFTKPIPISSTELRNYKTPMQILTLRRSVAGVLR